MWTASSSKVAGARTTLAFGVLVAGLLWSGPAHSGPIPVPGRGPIPAADAGRGEANCSIHFRARNTLAEDVWVLFSSSHWSTDERDGVTQAVFDGSNFRDIGDRRISPGDRLVEANTSRAGSCALERDFFIEVKFGTFDAGFGAAPVGESVTLHRETGHAGVGVVRGEASGELLLIVDLGESACWAALRPADTTVDNPMVGCEPDEEEEEPVQADSLIRITNLRSGLVCEEGSGEVGRPPSDRICRAHEISVRGRDTCIYDGEKKRCTWWGFEFDYENASPGEPLICIWTRSRAFNEGNYEDVNKHGIVTDTVRYEFEKARGHFFFPGFDTLPADGYPDPWLTVDMEYECTYRGRRAFGLEYEFIYSSEFQ